MSSDAGSPLPVHYRDDDPYTKHLGEVCDYSETGDMAHGCPRGCGGAKEHYSNDGHVECEDLPPLMEV